VIDIVGLQTRKVTLTHYEPGEWVNGRYERGAPTVVQFNASVQPMTPNEMLLLPEGQRATETVKIYACSNAMKVANISTGESGDLLEIEGVSFQVQQVTRYLLPGSALSHWKAIAVRKGSEGNVLS
jgi:hypothetical protein